MGETIGLRTVVARKPRPCLWCKDGIQPGEQYDRWMFVPFIEEQGWEMHFGWLLDGTRYASVGPPFKPDAQGLRTTHPATLLCRALLKAAEAQG